MTEQTRADHRANLAERRLALRERLRAEFVAGAEAGGAARLFYANCHLHVAPTSSVGLLVSRVWSVPSAFIR